ncbi:hypothetical protein OAV21_04370 [bacterium]|nr:hypothetical protein [Verrucomicrobiales bacterium]MDC3255604.1 hypothetical protein [bacterium]
MRLPLLFLAFTLLPSHALEQWETLILSFRGPQTSEQARVNPFTPKSRQRRAVSLPPMAMRPRQALALAISGKPDLPPTC